MIRYMVAKRWLWTLTQSESLGAERGPDCLE